MQLHPNRQRARQLILLFQIFAGLLALSIASDFFEYRLLSTMHTGVPDMDAVNANDIRQGLIGIVLILMHILGAVFFIRWFRRAYYNLHAAGTRGLQFDEGWAAGGWFVPFLNLVRPYHIMREVWTETNQQVGNGYVPNAKIGPWWGCFLLGGIIGNSSARLAMGADADLDDFLLADALNMISSALLIGALVLAIRIIRELMPLEDQLYAQQSGGFQLEEHLVA